MTKSENSCSGLAVYHGTTSSGLDGSVEQAERIQCVSKNIPDIFSCNSRKHCRIFI